VPFAVTKGSILDATISGRARGVPARPVNSRSQSRPADENKSYSPKTVDAAVSGPATTATVRGSLRGMA
jgi:hypothetical protein